jgi:PncC family amidohydrolase
VPSDPTTDRALGVASLLIDRRLTLAVMESCTGGLLAHTMTNLPGCGQFFLGAIVAYDTELKKRFGVPAEVIEKYGVFSEETAEAMALAVRTTAGADLGIGITGLAGPEPREGDPPGRIYIAACRHNQALTRALDLGDPGLPAVKQRAVEESLALLLELLGNP